MKTQCSISTSHEWRRFLLWLAAFVFSGILCVVGGIVLMDPYGLYQVINLAEVNAVKPELTQNVEEIKLTQSIKLRPDALILGNSRAEVGLDPESQAFLNRAYHAYNLAIRGTSITLSDRQLDYFLSKGNKPKIIIQGLEFLDFMAAPRPPTTSAAHPSDASFPVDRWYWRFDSLFSMTALKDAIVTAFIQADPEAATTTSRGFNPLREYRKLARVEGYFSIFQQKAKENTKTFLSKSSGMLDINGLDHLRGILDQSAESGTEVILLIYPYHAQILALFEETGLWPYFEDWKKLVQSEVAAAQQRHPNTRIALLDFSGFGHYQCERIPPKGDLKSATRWYWESGHFKKELGDVVLERALSLSRQANADAIGESSFGTWLDQASSEKNRQRIGRERIQCEQAYPELFADAKNLVVSARRK